MKLMEHQNEAVNEIMINYKNGINTIIYTSGVGTGKTSVFCGVAKQIEGKILYVVPKKTIIANVLNNKMFKQDEFEDRTDFITFNYFSDISKGYKLDEYELVVIDEAHHIGSDIYGKNLMYCINEHKVKALGLTATPERMDKIDIKEYFDVAVDGITNFEAILKGLMPRIEYLVCSPEEGIDLTGTKINWFKSYKLLKNAIEDNPKNKWICFFTKISELQTMKALLKLIFPGYKILEVHSRGKDTQKVLDKANKLEKCVMLNCDMLLEGLHFDNVDGIILFRNVQSVPVFEQIIGRVLTLFKKENPLVIDCTDTWLRMDRYITFNNSTDDTIKLNKSDDSDKVSNNKDVVSEINKPFYVSLKNKKYYEYMEFLREKHNKQQADLMICFRDKYYSSWQEASKEFNVSFSTVYTYRIKNAVSYEEALEYAIEYSEKNKYKKWSEEEIEILYKYYPIEGSSVVKRLKGKNEEQCRSYARRRNIKFKGKSKTKIKKLWSNQEIAILREYYPIEGIKVADRLEGRNVEQCRSKAVRLGIKKECGNNGKDRLFCV